MKRKTHESGGRAALDSVKKPYLLEVMGSGILVDMVMDAVKGVPSAVAAAKAQRRVEELLIRTGHIKK